MKKIKALYLSLGVMIGLLLSTCQKQPVKVVVKEVPVEVEKRVVVEKTVVKEVKVEVIVEKVVKEKEQGACRTVKTRKNRVTAGLGYGPNGKLDAEIDATTVTVTPRKGVVGTIGYERKVTDIYSIGVNASTNKTVGLQVGVDF